MLPTTKETKAILAVDFDGPLNTFSAEYARATTTVDKHDITEELSLIKKLDGITIANENDRNAIATGIHIARQDIEYIKPLFESLSHHGVKIICDSQRIAYTGTETSLKDSMYEAFDKAFGENRQFLLPDPIFEKGLQQHVDKLSSNKNTILENARNTYSENDQNIPVILMDNDASYKEPAKKWGFQFVEIPDRNYDLNSNNSNENKERATQRQVAYLKTWFISLANIMSPEDLRKEIEAIGSKYYKEFILLAADNDLLSFPKHLSELTSSPWEAIADITDYGQQLLKDKNITPVEQEIIDNVLNILSNQGLDSQKRLEEAKKVLNESSKKLAWEHSLPQVLVKFLSFFSDRMKAVEKYQDLQKRVITINNNPSWLNRQNQQKEQSTREQQPTKIAQPIAPRGPNRS